MIKNNKQSESKILSNFVGDGQWWPLGILERVWAMHYGISFLANVVTLGLYWNLNNVPYILRSIVYSTESIGVLFSR